MEKVYCNINNKMFRKLNNNDVKNKILRHLKEDKLLDKKYFIDMLLFDNGSTHNPFNVILNNVLDNLYNELVINKKNILKQKNISKKDDISMSISLTKISEEVMNRSLYINGFYFDIDNYFILMKNQGVKNA